MARCVVETQLGVGKPTTPEGGVLLFTDPELVATLPNVADLHLQCEKGDDPVFVEDWVNRIKNLCRGLSIYEDQPFVILW